MTSTPEPRRTGVRFKWCRPTRGAGFRAFKNITLARAASLAVTRGSTASHHSRQIAESQSGNEQSTTMPSEEGTGPGYYREQDQEPLRRSVSAASLSSSDSSSPPRNLWRDNSPVPFRNASPLPLVRALSPRHSPVPDAASSTTPSPASLSRPSSPQEMSQSSGSSSRSESPVPAVRAPEAPNVDDFDEPAVEYNNDSQSSEVHADSSTDTSRPPTPQPESRAASPTSRPLSPTLSFLAAQLATPSNTSPPPSYSHFEVPCSSSYNPYPPFDAPFAPSREDPFASTPRGAPFASSRVRIPRDGISLSRPVSPESSSGSDSNSSQPGPDSVSPSLNAISAAGQWSPALALPAWSADSTAPSWNPAPHEWSPASRAAPWNGPRSLSTWSAASHASHWNNTLPGFFWNGSPPSLWDSTPSSSLWSGSSPASLWSAAAPLSLWNSTPWRAPLPPSPWSVVSQARRAKISPEKRKRLAQYKSKKPLTLACHTSDDGVAAVLTRNLEDGEEYEIAVDIRSFLVCERTYTDIEKGIAALLFGIRKCHKYLTGRAFTIITDQEPLTRIFNPRLPMPNEFSPRYVRAAIALMSYHYDIIYRPLTDLIRPDEYEINEEDEDEEE